MISSVSIIGYGKLGSALAKVLHKSNILRSVISKQAVCLTNVNTYRSISDIEAITDIIFLCVPDKAITKIAKQLCDLKGNDLNDKIVAHCSGAMSKEDIGFCREYGAKVVSMHPYQTFFISDDDVFDGIGWGIEADKDIENDIILFVKKINGIPEILSAKTLNNRKLYHSSAVAASNFLASNIKTAFDLAERSGVDPRVFVYPIVKTTLKNSLEHNSIESGFPLTGPVVRGDINVINDHLSQITEPHLKKTFCFLGLATVEMAFANGLINEDLKVQVENIFKINL